MFEGRIRRILALLFGLYAVFLCRVLYLQTAEREAARETVESRRTTRVLLPPLRGALRDAGGLLLAHDDLGFDLLADTRGLGAASWECAACGRTSVTHEGDPGPGPDDLPPLPAEEPDPCRCGAPGTPLRKDAGAREELAALVGLPPEEFAGRVEGIRRHGWEVARARARARGERWRRLTLRDWLSRPRKVAGDIPREAALAIAREPERFRGFSVEARTVRTVNPDIDASTRTLLGRTGPATPRDEERLRGAGLTLGAIRSVEVGRSGVERAFDDLLRGSFGTESAARDLHGRILARETLEPVRDGEDLRLTCSAWLNAAAERILAGRPGALVALDPRTGAVRAMAGADPRGEGGPFPPISAYEPGSVFKVLTALAAVEGGVAPEAGEVECLGRGNRLIGCEKRHGRPGLREAISESCNAFFSEAALRVGVRPLEDHARRFRIDRPFGLGLWPEGGGTDWTQSDFPPPREWSRNDLANLGIGQGPLMLSPLQVAGLYAAVANGGRPVVPHLVEGQGREPGAPMLLPGTLAALRGGLEEAVRSGTASQAGLGAFRAAGKTGTAQAGGGQRLHAWFAGYAPAEDPRVVVVVVLLDQDLSGGRAAAPLAADFLEAWSSWSAGR